MLSRLVLVCVIALLFGFALEPGPARATPLVPSAAAEAIKPEAPVELARWFFFRRHHFRRHRMRRHRHHYGRHHRRGRGRHVRGERRDRVPAASAETAPGGASGSAPPAPAASTPERVPPRSPSGGWVEPAKGR